MASKYFKMDERGKALLAAIQQRLGKGPKPSPDVRPDMGSIEQANAARAAEASAAEQAAAARQAAAQQQAAAAEQARQAAAQGEYVASANKAVSGMAQAGPSPVPNVRGEVTVPRGGRPVTAAAEGGRGVMVEERKLLPSGKRTSSYMTGQRPEMPTATRPDLGAVDHAQVLRQALAERASKDPHEALAESMLGGKKNSLPVVPRSSIASAAKADSAANGRQPLAIDTTRPAGALAFGNAKEAAKVEAPATEAKGLKFGEKVETPVEAPAPEKPAEAPVAKKAPEPAKTASEPTKAETPKETTREAAKAAEREKLAGVQQTMENVERPIPKSPELPPLDPNVPTTLYRAGGLNDPRGTGIFLTTKKSTAESYSKNHGGAPALEYSIKGLKIKDGTTRWDLVTQLDPSFTHAKVSEKIFNKYQRDRRA